EQHELALLDGIRAIDDARTLGDVLDSVVQVRRLGGERVAVFVARGDRLHQWRAAGFIEGAAPAADFHVKDGGMLVEVLRRGSPARRSAGQRDAAAPPGAEEREAGAFPITIGGAVVAVLYADVPPRDEGADRHWRASFEVLSRHASR